MNAVRIAAALALLGAAFTAQAGGPVSLPVGTNIPLVTVSALSSATNVKGDLVALKTEDDVLIDGAIAIPKGTEAIGQIADAQAKGALGMSGRLVIRPLYLRLGSTVVRLSGAMTGKGSVATGAVVGLVMLNPGFTGRSATVPAGTKVGAIVEKSVTLN